MVLTILAKAKQRLTTDLNKSHPTSKTCAFNKTDWQHVFSYHLCVFPACRLSLNLLRLVTKLDIDCWLVDGQPHSGGCLALKWVCIVIVDLWYLSFTSQSLRSISFLPRIFTSSPSHSCVANDLLPSHRQQNRVLPELVNKETLYLTVSHYYW